MHHGTPSARAKARCPPRSDEGYACTPPGRNSEPPARRASRNRRTRWSSSPRKNFRSCRWPPRGCPTVRSGSGSTSRTGRSNLICTGYSPNWGSPPAVSFPGCSGAAHHGHLTRKANDDGTIGAALAHVERVEPNRTQDFFWSGRTEPLSDLPQVSRQSVAGWWHSAAPAKVPRPAGALLEPGFPYAVIGFQVMTHQRAVDDGDPTTPPHRSVRRTRAACPTPGHVQPPSSAGS